MVTEPQEFQYNLDECEIKVKQFDSFPNEWGLYFNGFSFLSFPHKKIQIAINDIIKKIKKKKGKYLVHTSNENDHDIRQVLYKVEFEDYFQNLESQLNLESFKYLMNDSSDYFIDHWSIYTKKLANNLVLNRFHELYMIECSTSDDIPNRVGFRHPTFKQFQQRFESKKSSFDTIFIARNYENIIGLTYSFEGKVPGIYYTGVHPNFRKLGIGTMLKNRMALHLKEKGYKLLGTSNRSTNLSVLKTNQKLGFKVVGRTFLLRRKII